MRRTQVYLTESEQRALKVLARRTGRSFAATLRDAVDAYLAREQGQGLEAAIHASFACWRERPEIADERALRREWDARESRFR